MAYRHVTLMSEHKGGTTIEEIVQKSAIRRAIESMERDTNGILTSDENKIAVANAIQQKKLLNNLEYQKRNEKIKGNTLTDFGYKKQSKEEKEYLMRKNS